MENLWLGFATATTSINLVWCLLGVTLGTLVGVLPGLGTMATISLLLPLTYSVGDPISSIIFMAGIYYGSQYGGSITAILLKLPGEASSTVTVLDGYAMTQRGRGGAALTITAVASFVGGSISILVISLLSNPLSEIAFLFGPAEYASLMLLGLAACISVTHGGLLRGLVMIVVGTWLGLIGTDISTGQARFTGGIVYLVDGISFAVMAIGIFGIGEILHDIFARESGSKKPQSVLSLYPSKAEARQSLAPTLRGTGLGTVLGLLPGGGAVLSSFLAYALERRISKSPDQFGKGHIPGVAAPEAANNASAQSQFLPTLMLGLPVTPVMALMVAVLIINGVQPGPNIMNTTPELFWGLIASMWIGNLMLLILNIPLVRIWIMILTIPKSILYPVIVIVSIFGAYSINNSWFDILLLLLFGFLGLVLRMARFEPAPLALAFVVAPLFEEYLTRALTISRGDYTTFLDSPISLTFLILSVVAMILSMAWRHR